MGQGGKTPPLSEQKNCFTSLIAFIVINSGAVNYVPFVVDAIGDVDVVVVIVWFS